MKPPYSNIVSSVENPRFKYLRHIYFRDCSPPEYPTGPVWPGMSPSRRESTGTLRQETRGISGRGSSGRGQWPWILAERVARLGGRKGGTPYCRSYNLSAVCQSVSRHHHFIMAYRSRYLRKEEGFILHFPKPNLKKVETVRPHTVGGQAEVIEHIVRHGLLKVSSVDLERKEHDTLDDHYQVSRLVQLQRTPSVPLTPFTSPRPAHKTSELLSVGKTSAGNIFTCN